MEAAFVILAIWMLLNILFVLIVIPPGTSRARTSASGTPLSPVPIAKEPGQLDQNEPAAPRRATSVALATLFVLVPPLMALRDAIARLFNKARRDDA
jgi:hypothetical protein